MIREYHRCRVPPSGKRKKARRVPGREETGVDLSEIGITIDMGLSTVQINDLLFRLPGLLGLCLSTMQEVPSTKASRYLHVCHGGKAREL